MKKAKKTDYLNLFALIEAARGGYFAEQLELQRSNRSNSGLKTEDYCIEFCKLKEKEKARKKNLSISLSDVERKHFHGDC